MFEPLMVSNQLNFLSGVFGLCGRGAFQYPNLPDHCWARTKKTWKNPFEFEIVRNAKNINVGGGKNIKS